MRQPTQPERLWVIRVNPEKATETYVLNLSQINSYVVKDRSFAEEIPNSAKMTL